MSPVPADDATDDSEDDAELSDTDRPIPEAYICAIIQMTDPELAADINRAAGRDDAAQLISPLSR